MFVFLLFVWHNVVYLDSFEFLKEQNKVTKGIALVFTLNKTECKDVSSRSPQVNCCLAKRPFCESLKVIFTFQSKKHNEDEDLTREISDKV